MREYIHFKFVDSLEWFEKLTKSFHHAEAPIGLPLIETQTRRVLDIFDAQTISSTSVDSWQLSPINMGND